MKDHFFNQSSRWYFPLHWLVLILLGLAIYAQSFGFNFVFDDNYYMLNTSYITSFDKINQIWASLPKTRMVGVYSFALNYWINQLHPQGYHIFNFIVHLLAVALVWATAAILFKIVDWAPVKAKGVKRPSVERIPQELPFMIALLFLVHPCQTQAVTYISQRFESMATVFYLGSIYTYLCGRITSSKNQRIFLFICSAGFAILGILTKEVAATIPLMILAVEFILLNKTPFNLKKFPSGRIYLLITALGIIFVLLFTKMVRTDFINVYFNSFQPSESHDGDMITGGKYVLTQLRVFLTFLRLFIFPVHQNLDYDYPLSTGLLNPPLTLAGLCVIGFIVFLIIRLRKRWPLISFGLAWVLITFSINTAPRSNVIFEHKLYLISFGFFLAAVSALSALIKDRKILFGLLIILIAVLSLASYKRNQVWKNELTLWDDAARKSPHKARPYNGLGIAYAKQGNFVQALLDFNTAIELNPNYAEAYNNRGNAYSKLGSYVQAGSDLNKAIEINPNYVDAYTNRGNIYEKQGKFSQALLDYNVAIQLNPNIAEAYISRGNIYEEEGNHVQALSDYNRAIAINPNIAGAYYNRVFASDKQSTNDVSDYDKAIAIDPNYAEAYYHRGLAYSKQGNPIQAVADFTKAIEIDPGHGGAYYNRGLIFAKQGDFAHAMSDFNKAIQINPTNEGAYINRGVILSQESYFTQALLDYNKAILLKPNDANAYINRGTFYAQHGSLTQALSDYNKAIELDPGFDEVYFNRSVIYYQLKEYGKAWGDVHKSEGLGAVINPKFITALKQASGKNQ